MKKVLLIANDTTYVYNLRKELLIKLIEENYNVVIVSEKKQFVHELENIGCKIINVIPNRHSKNPFNDFKLFKKYKGIIRQESPDIILTYNIKPNIYAGLSSKKVNFIPNITGLGTAVEYPGFLQKLTIMLYRKSMKNANCIMFQNSENIEFFKKHKIINEMTHIELLPGSGVNVDEKKYFDYPHNDVVKFLFVGRALKEKGVDLYIELAKKIKSNFDNVEFLICGQCDDKKYIDIYKKETNNGIIKYCGIQNDMIDFYKNCNCLIHPSYYPEGMSNVLLEACSTGRPIITTDRSGCREIVDDGINGYLVGVNDFSSLYNATVKFLKLSLEEKEMMGIQGRKKIEDKFDRRIVVEKYMKIIRNV